MSDFLLEQKEMLTIIEGKMRRSRNETSKRFSWNKFNGDVVCRVVKEFLQRHLPDSLKVAGPNVFIVDFPTDFDLMIVDSKAQPIEYTNCYRSEDVRHVIEIKGHGYMSRSFPAKLHSQFERITREFPKIKCVYLTIRETWKPKKASSISYVEKLKEVLEPRYRVSCLKDSRTNEIFVGQWDEFVRLLKGETLESEK